jgi:hypothetical protein
MRRFGSKYDEMGNWIACYANLNIAPRVLEVSDRSVQRHVDISEHKEHARHVEKGPLDIALKSLMNLLEDTIRFDVACDLRLLKSL